MPKPHLTPAQQQQAEELLARAKASQTAFWNDLHELEEVLGISVDAEADLAETPLSHLLTIRDTRPEMYQ